jgi:hypothetical protein
MLLPAFAPAVVAGLVLMLWLMLMAQAWQQSRSRRQLQRDLARIFEQLDLLGMGASEPEHATATRQAPTVHAFGGTDDGDTIDELVERGASARELAARCGIPPAEARILVAMRGAPGRRGTLQ